MTTVATPRRVVRFALGGAAGFLLQVGVLAALTRLAGLHYVVATALAVEAAILCNFLLHDRWTWGDRPPMARRDRWRRLLHFNALGGTSLAGNLLVTAVLVEAFGLAPLAANVLAVAVFSGVNFVVADARVFRV